MSNALYAFDADKKCTDYVSGKMCVKIGQMLMVGFGGVGVDGENKIIYDDQNNLVFNFDSDLAHSIKYLHVGSVILFSRPIYDRHAEKIMRLRNVQGPKQLAKLNQDMKRYSKKIRAQQGLSAMPLWIAIDQEGGMIDRLGYKFGFKLPRVIPQALGEKQERAKNSEQRKKALAQTNQFAQKIGALLKQEHIDIDFAPVVDVNVNPTNPIIGALGRSFSGDPKIVVDQAQQVINGLHQHQVIAVLKHFPGHGSSTSDSHNGFADVTDVYQKDIELLPYKKLISNGYHDMIMTTHVVNGQIDQTQCKHGEKNDHSTWCPGTMSKKTLTTLLRDQLGYNGIVISDDMTMGAITDEYELTDALAHAINAGVDMFIIANHNSNHTRNVVLTIAKLVHDGTIKKERIDDAYRRVSVLKGA